MAVLRIVADLAATRPVQAAAFYEEVFGLEIAMDEGWIVTLTGAGASQGVQLSLASEGGSGTELPALSIEVDDLDAALERAEARGAKPEYGPVQEPWGVRRFFLRDPAGHLINVLTHAPGGAD